MGLPVHDFHRPRISSRIHASLKTFPSHSTYRSAHRHPLGIPRTLTQRDLRTAGALPSRDPSNAPQSKTYNECVSEIRLAGQAQRLKEMRGTNMRYISALAVAVLALVFGTATAVAQPGGSYQQTCRKIGVRGSTLYAECQNTGGGWQSTELRDYNRCRGEIQIIN